MFDLIMIHRASFLIIIISLFLGCEPLQDNPGEKSGFIEINQTQHYYNFVGEGDTLVVLHGGPGLSHHYLKPQLDSLLASEFTLLYYDQRGSGWTEGEKDTIQLHIESFVQDLDQLRDHFELSKLNLLGHSFGGLLAMYYGIEFPNKVNSLVLVDTDAASYALRTPYQIKMINSRLTERQNAYLDSLEQTDEFKNYDPKVYEDYYQTFLTSYFADPADAAKVHLGFDSKNVPKISSTNSRVRSNLGKYDIHGKHTIIDCKTLIMQGNESVFSVEGAMAIHDQIPNSEIHLFDDCGHFEYIEAPDKFKKLVLNFYSRK
ncbi:MAG: alpha/beta fold hydrolase [Saprospiraceae bacterium]|nr:alpha/beta fold hydrolase [Saprospiraceae bacterium]